MTRRMESIFLRSPDHLTLEAALRRAELLSLDANDHLVAAVLATRLGSDLANASFWRTVMEFFVRVSDRLNPTQVGPIVDFLQAVRHERVEVTTQEGLRLINQPEPHFSIKGRSLASIQRLVDAWHRRLGRQAGRTLVWPRSRQQPLMYEERQLDPDLPPVRWEVVELTSSIDLRMEGQALQHCVASYAPYCASGLSRIWSLRRITGSSTFASVATIEVNPRARRDRAGTRTPQPCRVSPRPRADVAVGAARGPRGAVLSVHVQPYGHGQGGRGAGSRTCPADDQKTKRRTDLDCRGLRPRAGGTCSTKQAASATCMPS